MVQHHVCLRRFAIAALCCLSVTGCKILLRSTQAGSTLVLSPATASLAVGNTLQLEATGGAAPYTYQVATNPAQGTVSLSGLYTAPLVSGSNTVTVTDSTGAKAQASLTIVESLSMSPSAATSIVGLTETLEVTGGVAPFSFSLVSGSGSVTAEGVFAAPWAADTSIVQVSDSLGNTALATRTRSSGSLSGGTNLNDVLTGGAVDTDGNIYIAGTTTGSLPGQVSLGGYDAFIVKMNAAGVVQWRKQIGSSTYDRASGLAIDSNNNVYVAGVTNGAFDGNAQLGSYDAFLYACNSSGDKIFSTQFGTASGDYATAIAVDSVNSALYVTGYTSGSLQGANAGQSDVFLRRYSFAGAVAWTAQTGNSQSDQSLAVAVDALGFVYITGAAGSSGGSPSSFNGVAYPAGVTPAFVVKYSSAGLAQWTVLPNTAGDYPSQGSSLVVDQNGSLYVSFLDYDALVNNNYGTAIASFSTQSGATNWVAAPSLNNYGLQASSVTIDALNNPILSSTQSIYDSESAQYYFRGIQAKFNTTTGSETWIQAVGQANKTSIGTVAAKSSDGQFSFLMGFSNDSLDGHTNLGQYDYFVSKFNSAGALQ
jgi:hypothetical protein